MLGRIRLACWPDLRQNVYPKNISTYPWIKGNKVEQNTIKTVVKYIHNIINRWLMENYIYIDFLHELFYIYGRSIQHHNSTLSALINKTQELCSAEDCKDDE